MVSVYAYFGPAGTFTEMALDTLLRRRGAEAAATKLPVSNPPAVIESIRCGDADFGCVPIESSLEGAVPATMDALVPRGDQTRVQAYAEVALDIAFTVAAAAPLDPADVRTVAAYPVAAGQVRRSIEERFPNAEIVVSTSNSGAARDVSQGNADAAVTTAAAARMYGLTALAEGVADSDDAVTRFLLLGRPGVPPEPTGADRTSVVLDLPNAPGSLVAAMNEFAMRGIDLTRIESRPRAADPAHGDRGSGQYRFYLDARGHVRDAAVGEALRALHRTAERVVFLGSWAIDPRLTVTAAATPDHESSREWFEHLLLGDI
ncbi:prephenate dehydratase [Gordonia neofelifaecis]|uniref:Prephenate dehydratase n=1 Tax=Gordonia neofelifaecis NRRL B-59395 TaxID=644548 RepID=F1YMI8_9ACTN|nr:prephenate dehydratase [Gordonia neofelifaecis]EGD54113.1 prephenate dehydratase [Gordonia neofelifaecis NRRL B-59395]